MKSWSIFITGHGSTNDPEFETRQMPFHVFPYNFILLLLEHGVFNLSEENHLVKNLQHDMLKVMKNGNNKMSTFFDNWMITIT